MPDGNLLNKLRFFRPRDQKQGCAEEKTADNWSETRCGQREWEDFYRRRWQYDKKVRSTHGVNCIPFFFFYSMFGFQRVGDSIWAHADMRGRGFLIGATPTLEKLTNPLIVFGRSIATLSLLPSGIARW